MFFMSFVLIADYYDIYFVKQSSYYCVYFMRFLLYLFDNVSHHYSSIHVQSYYPLNHHLITHYQQSFHLNPIYPPLMAKILIFLTST